MTTTTVVVGLALVFLLFTRIGRIIGIVLLGVAFVGAFALYADANWPWVHQPIGDTAAGIFAVVVVLYVFGSAFYGATKALERTMAKRREQAVRLWILEHPLDGEILPPQRHLSP